MAEEAVGGVDLCVAEAQDLRSVSARPAAQGVGIFRYAADYMCELMQEHSDLRGGAVARVRTDGQSPPTYVVERTAGNVPLQHRGVANEEGAVGIQHND